MNHIQAARAKSLISQAASTLQEAIDIMQEHDLNLVNYPEGWKDFQEHPFELRNLIVTDFQDVRMKVGKGRPRKQ